VFLKSFANRCLLLGHVIESKKSKRRKGKEIEKKEKKEITPSHDKVVTDYNRDDNTQQELVELINRVQRHAKCSSYCLHHDKTTREEVCRFHFPQDLHDLTELVQKEGESLPEFLTKRNDPYLNSYNPTWILGWCQGHSCSLANSQVTLYGLGVPH